MFEVVYYPNCGGAEKMCHGIEKVAEAIAVELDVKAEDIKSKNGLAKDSFVFLGSGCYGVKRGEELQEFIARNDFKGRKVALFGTSGNGKGNEVKAIEEMLKPASAHIAGSFCCKGHPSILFKEHPNDEELTGAREFASEMKK